MLSSQVYTVFLEVLIVILLCTVLKSIRSRSSIRLPPGPRTSFLGRINIPAITTYPWKTYIDWKKIYGDVVYYNFLGHHFVVLNSRKAVKDLMENQSSIYSARPNRVMANELVGWRWLMSSIPYGNEWRRHRRLFHQYFNQTSSKSYYDIQTKEARSLLRSLLDNPADFPLHVRKENAAIIMKISYGYQISNENDFYVQLSDDALSTFAKSGLFGTYMVDYFPALKYIPSWFPGAKFKREASEWAEHTRAMIEEPFQMAKRSVLEGKAVPSIATTGLEALALGKATYYDENIVKDVSAVSYAAGAETTVSTILGFFLAMVLYPEVQKKAQAEIDKEVGSFRLPTFADRSKLPYVTGLVFECLRWNPVVPLGQPHMSSRENIYNGMRIPKNTTMIVNAWGILHDKNLYPEPMVFRPERFIGKSPNGVNEFPIEGFGAGRRICPGRYFAEATVWMTIVSILATFNLSKAIDDSGNEIEPDPNFTSGFLSRPKPFKCRIEPRSEAALRLVMETGV